MSTSIAPDTSVPAPIPQGAGYAVLIGFGFVFAVMLIYATRLLKKYNNEDNSRFETFSTAGRKIGTGLTGTAVLSSWLWSTAVLSSTVVTYSESSSALSGHSRDVDISSHPPF